MLPETYAVVHPVNLESKQPPVPHLDGTQSPNDFSVLQHAIQREKQWLDSVADQLLEVEQPDDNLIISWSGFHASNSQNSDEVKPCVSAIMPPFAKSSKSVGMLVHSLNVIKKATNHINPNQKPIAEADQPIFATLKQIQWNFPDEYGESEFIIMMGGLHIEMCALSLLGDWLEGNGCIEAVNLDNITSSGIANKKL